MKSKKKNIKITWILLILIIGIVVFSIYFLNKKDNVTQIAKTEEQTAKAYTEEIKTTEDGFEYKICEFSDNTKYAYITGYTGTATEITIPSTIDNVEVITICKEAFEGNSEITSVIISEGIKEICCSAFSNCTGLISIIIPDSVTEIGDSAFDDCMNLTNITIPNGVTEIKDAVFYCCLNLTNITIPDGVTEIGDEAFESCMNLTSVTMPNSVTKIGDSAFFGCSSLTSITIPDGVTEIGDKAFKDCTNLIDITIPDSVTTIGYNVFDDNNLTEENKNDINFEYLVYNVNGNKYAYIKRYVGKETEVVIPNTIEGIPIVKIGNKAFFNSSNIGRDTITSVIIPDGITEIGDSAFYGCDSLTSITIPNSVTKIGDSVFFHCSALTNITIPNSVTKIGDSAFSGCSSLTSITIPNSITEIGDSAFSGCHSLTSITIPDSVTKIGAGAFYYAQNLESVTSVIIPDSVTEIECDAFDETIKIYSYSEDSEAIKYAKTHGRDYEIIKEGEEPEDNSTNITETKVGTKDTIKGLTIDKQGITVETLKTDNYFANKTVKFLNSLGKELTSTDKIGTGTKVQITDASGNTSEKTILIYGDTNGDGLINAIDALAIIKNKSGAVKFTDEIFAEAGKIISTTGTPSAVDALAIVKYKNGTYNINQNK